jgi:hypothetical protein
MAGSLTPFSNFVKECPGLPNPGLSPPGRDLAIGRGTLTMFSPSSHLSKTHLPLGHFTSTPRSRTGTILAGAEFAYPLQYPAEHIPGHNLFCKLKHQPSGTAHQPSTYLDQPSLYTPQRPVLHRLRQCQPSYEVPQVVGQDEEPQPHLIGHEPVAGETGPIESVLPLLDPLLRRAPSIVESSYTLWRIAQVGDDKSDPKDESIRFCMYASFRNCPI